MCYNIHDFLLWLALKQLATVMVDNHFWQWKVDLDVVITIQWFFCVVYLQRMFWQRTRGSVSFALTTLLQGTPSLASPAYVFIIKGEFVSFSLPGSSDDSWGKKYLLTNWNYHQSLSLSLNTISVVQAIHSLKRQLNA